MCYIDEVKEGINGQQESKIEIREDIIFSLKKGHFLSIDLFSSGRVGVVGLGPLLSIRFCLFLLLKIPVLLAVVELPVEKNSSLEVTLKHSMASMAFGSFMFCL